MEATATLARPIEMPAWKTIVSHVAAAAVAVLFLSSGIWKITDPFGWARMVEEFLVPAQFSLALALFLGIAETSAGALVLIPRVRKWGAGIAAGLLIIFMSYVGLHYNQLVGKDCSCFPIVKRAVNPMFFVEDGGMLLFAIVAGWLARPATGKRIASIILAAIVLASGTGYAAAVAHQSGTKAPASITVDGQPYSLEYGRVFVFFYDPNCGHCDAAARAMSKLHWRDDVTTIAIPVQNPRFAAAFLHDTGLKAKTSLDLDLLKKTFPFGDAPYGVALDNGHELGPVPHYEGSEPADTLRKFGFIE
ncbi:MAG TPA: MauE/DoxX family redox-associated membrane protein [Bryobacteraceae bacterium]|nr:MauE/DoxX family redox-associated membrane protein [Bryobacteraceae bacterium]